MKYIFSCISAQNLPGLLIASSNYEAAKGAAKIRAYKHDGAAHQRV